MARTAWIAGVIAAACVFLSGCSSKGSDTEYSAQEIDKLKNPSKELPPQLGDTMKRAAEDTKAKMEASTKKGG